MITVVTPVSPIASHPDTAILEETLDSVRHHLPDAEIILCFDGVRPEQMDRKADYDEFIRKALWLADHKYGNVLPMLHNKHQHQTGMMRPALDEIKTPLLMYVEADTPLVTDEPIDFGAITNMVESGRSSVVRLHHEGVVPTDHAHMMHGHECDFPGDYLFLRTSQWSQRPHVASKAYYQRILHSYFSPQSKSFIEDQMHGIVDEAFNMNGVLGWYQHRVHIYDPGNGNMKRSYHLDGRAGEAKYDSTQVF